MGKVIFRGPCDVTAICHYLRKKNLEYDTELKGTNINIVWDTSLSIYLKQVATDGCVDDVFVEKNHYPDRSIFTDTQIKGVVISVLNEGYNGVYRNKKNGKEIAYGLWPYDATFNDGYEYLDGQAKWCGYPKLTKKDYVRLSKEYCFLGRINPKESAKNIKVFVDRFMNNAVITIILGPTFTSKYGEKSPVFKDGGGVDFYSNLNNEIINLIGYRKNVRFVNPNDYYISPKKQKDLFYYNYPSLGHYPRRTYISMAKKLVKEYKGVLHKSNTIRFKDYCNRTIKAIKAIICRF